MCGSHEIARGANHTVATITEVCCTVGVCTTERYRLCGC